MSSIQRRRGRCTRGYWLGLIGGRWCFCALFRFHVKLYNLDTINQHIWKEFPMLKLKLFMKSWTVNSQANVDIPGVIPD